jgi:hypothetical protein
MTQRRPRRKGRGSIGVHWGMLYRFLRRWALTRRAWLLGWRRIRRLWFSVRRRWALTRRRGFGGFPCLR